MSHPIVAFIVISIITLLRILNIPLPFDESVLTETVQNVVVFIVGIYGWYARYSKGDVNILGAYKPHYGSVDGEKRID